MKSALHRAIVFGATAFVVLVFADLAVWGVNQAMRSRDELLPRLLVHGRVHVAVLILSIVGATVAFSLLRRRLPSTQVASLLGAVFAAVSFFTLFDAFTAGGVVLAAAWLLVGSAIAALIGGFIATRHEG